MSHFLPISVGVAYRPPTNSPIPFSISQVEIQSKADAQHSHALAHITGLTDELASKAALHHGHYIQHVHELQQELTRRADINHRHQYASLGSD
jgi:hypothetical protein